MGLTLAALATDIKRVDCEWDGQTFWIDVNIAAVTPQLEQQLADLATGEGITRLLAVLIVAWEILDGDKDQIPVTVEALSGFPYTFIEYLSQQAMGASRPNPTKAETSAAG